MWTIQKCFDTDNDVYLALLQIHSTLMGPGLPSPAALMFNIQIRDSNVKTKQISILFNHYDDHYIVLIERQESRDKSGYFQSFPISTYRIDCISTEVR